MFVLYLKLFREFFYYKHFRGSLEFPNQNLREIGPGAYDQTYK